MPAQESLGTPSYVRPLLPSEAVFHKGRSACAQDSRHTREESGRQQVLFGNGHVERGVVIDAALIRVCAETRRDRTMSVTSVRGIAPRVARVQLSAAMRGRESVVNRGVRVGTDLDCDRSHRQGNRSRTVEGHLAAPRDRRRPYARPPWHPHETHRQLRGTSTLPRNALLRSPPGQFRRRGLGASRILRLLPQWTCVQRKARSEWWCQTSIEDGGRRTGRL